LGGIPRTGHVSAYVLHWLPFQYRIVFRISALVWRGLLSLALAYPESFAISPWAPEGAVPFDLWNRGCSIRTKMPWNTIVLLLLLLLLLSLLFLLLSLSLLFSAAL